VNAVVLLAAMPDDATPSTSEPDVSRPRKPSIVAHYSSGYKPPFDISRTIDRMLASVPSRYLVGLSEIVLTDRGELPRKRRRGVTYSRKKKVRILQARGMYHPASKATRAWIEIFVDATVKPWEKGLWSKIPLIRELDLGQVLFHEIGHHIHYTVRPEYREKEDVVDVWKVRLERNYYRQRFSFLKVPFRLFRFFAGPILDRLSAKATKRMLQDGLISQAEFEESTRTDHPKLG
jgi:hypothetical protein